MMVDTDQTLVGLSPT